MDDTTRPDTNQRALKLSLNLGIPSNSLHSPFFDTINQFLTHSPISIQKPSFREDADISILSAIDFVLTFLLVQVEKSTPGV